MPVLEMRHITKSFPGVLALDDVDLTLKTGEIHSIVGENGAGKSTLIKILSGVYPDGSFAGQLLVDGQATYFRSVADSETAGVAVIFQELSLVSEMSVGENIFLGKEPGRFGLIDHKELYRRTTDILQELKLSIDPHAATGDLGVGQQQLIEIAKALSRNARILVLDEPTAALTQTEAEKLFSIIDDLRKGGTAIIYISHRLDDVLRLSDRITVLRDGKAVASFTGQDVDKERLLHAVVGREISEIFPNADRRPGPVALQVDNLSLHSNDASPRKIVDSVSLVARQGEVIGIAGLMGSGRTELLKALFGVWRGKTEGGISIEGKPVTINSPADAIANGIGFVTEDRKQYGFIPDATVVDNMTLAALTTISGSILTNKTREASAAEGPVKALHLKGCSLSTSTGSLSGGNQQKVVIGKWLLTRPKVLLLDEPTRGIDVGAKQEIYAQINKLASEGMAIVLVSSELPEVLGLADRVIVLNTGRITGEFERESVTPENVITAAAGQRYAV
jgi:D-xylose transport system ATP-binding protein